MYATNATRIKHFSTIFSILFHRNHKETLKHFLFSIFPQEQNFDIDAGDGVGGWDHLGPQKYPKIPQKY